MLRSLFTFLRGSAALMAYDLACTPSSGLRVQACGKFALAYADQNERDHAALVAAVSAGRVEALVEGNL